jgi:hypothetical protein
MNKKEIIRNREAARVLIIAGLDLIEKAKEKVLDIDSDPTFEDLWTKAQDAIWEMHTYNCDDQRLDK